MRFALSHQAESSPSARRRGRLLACCGLLLVGLLAWPLALLPLTGCNSAAKNGPPSSTAESLASPQEAVTEHALQRSDSLRSRSLHSAAAAARGLFSPPARWRIAFASDLNERYGDACYEQHTLDAMRAIRLGKPDLVVLAGDIVAGQKKGLDYHAMWAAFERDVFAPLNGIPLAQTPGNHDASGYPRFAEERAIYLDVWSRLPRPERDGRLLMLNDAFYPLRYTLALGPAFIVFLDATHRDVLSDSVQVDWLESQLASDFARSLPVKIVVGHLPLFPLARGREKDFLLNQAAIRERVVRLFDEHRVDLYVSGHHHAFFSGVSPPLATRLVGLGCLGGGPRALLNDRLWVEEPGSTAERSIAWVELDEQQIVSVEAYRGPSFGSADRLERRTLPQFAGLDEFVLIRDDLVLH